MNDSVYQGGCLCGHLRYRAAGAPHAPHYCHCRMCQRVVGAPAVAWVNLPRAGFTFSAGEPAYYSSSRGIRRGFCPRCGASICTEEGGDDYICITIATLDEPERIRPGYHIWTSSQLSWLTIVDGLPRRAQ